jgi:PhzF family phenazine biosynthesis protein
MRIFQVDAFTSEPFKGNPAAVCLMEGERDDAWMQALAQEMNLSETAFVTRRDNGFGLRWFTPGAEVDLCGHATLASAHVLWELGEPDTTLRFHTRSGELVAERASTQGPAPEIRMDFPATPAAAAPPFPDLAKALGVDPVWVGRTKFDYLIEVADEATVRGVRPDFATLRTLPVRGVIVSARGDDGCDFVSRFFAPGVGIDEDPVTGSAHCSLAPYWSAKLGRDELLGYQASPRGGYVRVRLAAGGSRVILSGRAVTILRGELC